VIAAAPVPTETLVPQSTEPPGGSGLPLEAVVAGLVLVGVLTYLGLYWLGTSASNRYAGGFVFEICPVCQRGAPVVEQRQERWFGIPRIRHIVRCNECRSVLRETSPRHWRYAVDPSENAALYQQYNGREIDDTRLARLARQAGRPTAEVRPWSPDEPPTFVDDDEN
jgi:hypothetical protein